MKGLNQTFIGQMGTNTTPWDPDGAIETETRVPKKQKLFKKIYYFFSIKIKLDMKC